MATAQTVWNFADVTRALKLDGNEVRILCQYLGIKTYLGANKSRVRYIDAEGYRRLEEAAPAMIQGRFRYQRECEVHPFFTSGDSSK